MDSIDFRDIIYSLTKSERDAVLAMGPGTGPVRPGYLTRGSKIIAREAGLLKLKARGVADAEGKLTAFGDEFLSKLSEFDHCPLPWPRARDVAARRPPSWKPSALRDTARLLSTITQGVRDLPRELYYVYIEPRAMTCTSGVLLVSVQGDMGIETPYLIDPETGLIDLNGSYRLYRPLLELLSDSSIYGPSTRWRCGDLLGVLEPVRNLFAQWIARRLRVDTRVCSPVLFCNVLEVLHALGAVEISISAPFKGKHPIGIVGEVGGYQMYGLVSLIDTKPDPRDYRLLALDMPPPSARGLLAL